MGLSTPKSVAIGEGASGSLNWGTAQEIDVEWYGVQEWRHEDIVAAALGTVAYPWEEAPGTFRNIPELRILSDVVKACLCRDACLLYTSDAADE